MGKYMVYSRIERKLQEPECSKQKEAQKEIKLKG